MAIQGREAANQHDQKDGLPAPAIGPKPDASYFEVE
jgi:hypothetical protein